MNNTVQLLNQYITEELLHDLPEVALSGDDDLLISGLIDSLGVMQLVAFIEETFAVEVRPEDITIENFQTLNVIAGFLQKRRQTLAGRQR